MASNGWADLGYMATLPNLDADCYAYCMRTYTQNNVFPILP
ncbi:hypothetical protein [uncultured Acinetobacter sp.]|nr:hypothetical protein [uncultured Acinetobacter sp.]